MKKFILLGAAVALSASAALAAISDAEIIELYQGITAEGVNVKIAERGKLAGTNFEQIIVELSMGDQKQKQIMFSDGKYLFPDVIDTKARVSHRAKFEEEQEKARLASNYHKLATIIKSMDKNKIISLGGNANKTLYVFTDPHCPYCRQEIAHVETQLKAANIKMIFAPIPSHGDEALAKAIAIQKECVGVKSDSAKIAIIKKYFDPKAKAPKDVTKEQIEEERKAVNSIFATGAINGVPAFIDAADLK
jgi:thiol:disulfide interchange protein DsbC